MQKKRLLQFEAVQCVRVLKNEQTNSDCLEPCADRCRVLLFFVPSVCGVFGNAYNAFRIKCAWFERWNESAGKAHEVFLGIPDRYVDDWLLLLRYERRMQSSKIT